MFFTNATDKGHSNEKAEGNTAKGKRVKRKSDDGWSGQGWGGYMKEKERKLAKQFEQLGNSNGKDTARSNIFKGVCIFVNGYTNPSSDHLKQIMSDHGGQYQHYYSKTICTHIIATNLPDSKIKELRNEKIVHPNWILDSVNAQKCLPVGKYLLYNAPDNKQASMFVKINRRPCSTVSSNKEKLVECQDSSGERKSEVDDKTDKFDVSDVDNFKLDLINSDVEIDDYNSIDRNTDSAPTARMQMDIPRREIMETEEPVPVALEKEKKESSSVNDFNNSIERRDDVTAPFLSKHNYQNTAHTKPCSKAGDPGFMNDFYSNSRLHHLSMWRSELKKYATMIHKIASTKHRNTEKKSKHSHRCIMHIDMDSFFVSVALKERPDLIGKPVAVCHASKGTNSAGMTSMSEIASCSYEARGKGVRNGMFLGGAKSLCPELICVPYKFESYRKVSLKFYEILASYTSEIEAVSCDEALLDITDLITEDNNALNIASKMRASIYENTGCRASAGIASNILLARLATRKAKPNGQFHLAKEDEQEFIGRQNVSDLPGVGRSLDAKLKEMRVTTCTELQLISLSKLQEKFGPKTGLSLHKHCRGKDDRTVKTEHERMSVSAEINYGIRFEKDNESVTFIKELANEVQDRLKNIQMKGSHVTLKVMVRKKGAPEPQKHMGHGICDNISRSNTIMTATDDSDIISKECITLLRNLGIKSNDIRGMGIQIGKLVKASPTNNSINTINFASNVKPKPADNCSHIVTENAVNSGNSSDIISLNSHTSKSMVSDTRMNGGKHVIANQRGRQNKKKSPRKSEKKPKSSNSGTLENFVTTIPVRTSPQRQSLAQSVTAEPPLPSLFLSPGKVKTSLIPAHYDLPSPSQVDLSVFNALPADVQRSIKQAYKANNQHLNVDSLKRNSLKESNEHSDYTMDSDTAMLKSHVATYSNDHLISQAKSATNETRENTVHMENQSKRSHVNNKLSYDDDTRSDDTLSLSHIDMEVMNELPTDLKEEVLQSLKYEERIKRNRNGKKQLRVPTDASKCFKNFNVLNSKSSHKNESNDAALLNIDMIADRKDALREEQQMNTCTENQEKQTVSSDFIEKKTKYIPSLYGGRTKYEDVKELVRAWVNSTDEPFMEDIQEIITYFEELIVNRNMEQAFLLMKFVKRSSNSSMKWNSAVNIIENRVQKAVLELYGGKFAL